MGKRPFYLITHHVDCDGYTTYIDYLGVNGPAAIDRFKHLVQDVRDRYFTHEGVEDVFFGNEQDWESIMNLSLDQIDKPGKAYTAWMNDDNCCWISVKIMVIETGEFFNYPTERRWDDGYEIWTDNRGRETQYKETHPNAKY